MRARGTQASRSILSVVAVLTMEIVFCMDARAQQTTITGAYLQLMLQAKVGWVVGEAVGGYGTIIKTSNGGLTWTRQGTVGEIPDLNMSCVAAVDRDTAWVVGGGAGQGAVLRTINGGRTWQSQKIPAGSQGYELNGIYALDTDTAWAVGYGAVILHTSDGGQTWTRQGQATLPDVPLYSVYASDAKNVWAIGWGTAGNIGTVVRSTDGGGSWQEILYTLKRFVTQKGLIMIHGVAADTVWVVGPAQVSFTETGGKVWVDQWVPEMVDQLHVNGVFAVDREYVWLARDQGAIYHSTDGGAHYTLQDAGFPGDEILRIAAVNRSTAWAVTTFFGYPIGGHVLFTADAGKTWVAQQTPVTTYWNWVSFVR